jgi:hypothetical protein
MSTKKFDLGNEIRAIARERIGCVPRRRVMVPKIRKPQKHKESYESA